jgi:hypothetical protein
MQCTLTLPYLASETNAGPGGGVKFTTTQYVSIYGLKSCPKDLVLIVIYRAGLWPAKNTGIWSLVVREVLLQVSMPCVLWLSHTSHNRTYTRHCLQTPTTQHNNCKSYFFIVIITVLWILYLRSMAVLSQQFSWLQHASSHEISGHNHGAKNSKISSHSIDKLMKP